MVPELQGIDFRRGLIALALPALLVAALLMEIPSRAYSFKARNRRRPATWAAFVDLDGDTLTRLSARIRTTWQLSASAKVSGSPDPAAGLYLLEDAYPPPEFMALPRNFADRPVASAVRIPRFPLFALQNAAPPIPRQPALAPAGNADVDREKLRQDLSDIDAVFESFSRPRKNERMKTCPPPSTK